MSNQALKSEIKTYAQEIGIDLIGFATAEPFTSLEPVLRDKQAKNLTTGFEHPVIEERIDPALIFDKPKSLIAIALAYPSQIPHPVPNERANRRGSFARVSWGVDYHKILTDKLNQLIQFIQTKRPEANFKAMVDTGELSDVAVAERAGLGFIGRNSLLINPQYGSWLYLGELITDLEFEPDEPIENGCGDCYRCVQACPGQALSPEGMANPKRCLSYQTQVKGYMETEFRRKMGTVIYGCDICQYVCPYNQGVDIHHHPEMEPDPEVVQPLLKEMLTLSNREFKETYGHLSGAWRGKKPLQRNAIIALANYRDRSALPLLLEIMESDSRPMIRGTAAWAIAQIQSDYNPQLIETLKQQGSREEDPETIKEFDQAISRLEAKRKKG